MIRDEPNRIHQAELSVFRPAELVPIRPATVQPTWVAAPAQRRTGRPSVRTWLVGLAVLLAAAAVTGLMWLLVLAVLELIALVTAAVAWVFAHWGLLVLVAFVLVLLTAGGSRCPGLHCGGCRH